MKYAKIMSHARRFGQYIKLTGNPLNARRKEPISISRAICLSGRDVSVLLPKEP